MLPLLWSNVSARIDTIQSLDKHIEIIHTNTCTIHRQVNFLPNEKTIFRIRTQTDIKPQLLHFTKCRCRHSGFFQAAQVQNKTVTLQTNIFILKGNAAYLAIYTCYYSKNIYSAGPNSRISTYIISYYTYQHKIQR